ncbi:MAG: YceI family protein [Pseudomonadota bacterium]|nr:YceI family protein [Pseudomonadota bacterium]
MNKHCLYSRTVLLLLGVLILGLAGCAQQADRKAAKPEATVVPSPEVTVTPVPVPAPVPPPEPEEKPSSSQTYRIDAAASDIWIFVYRKGNLSRLGHDHVIAAGKIDGSVRLTDPVNDSSLEMSIPVASLVVDDPDVRNRAGLESGSNPEQKDIDSTRRGMLGEKILDAEQFGAVRIEAQVAGGKLPALELDLSITIRGVTKKIRSPARLEKTAGKIIVTGNLEIKQSDYGIAPFSVLAGALAVKDELKIQYRIVSREAE